MTHKSTYTYRSLCIKNTQLFSYVIKLNHYQNKDKNKDMMNTSTYKNDTTIVLQYVSLNVCHIGRRRPTLWNLNFETRMPLVLRCSMATVKTMNCA